MQDDKPPVINYVVSFILVGLAWGLTTPFIRRAARAHQPPPHPTLHLDSVKNHWLRSRLYGAFFAVADLLRNPRYALPLLLNLTGSIWFFLLIGHAGMSLILPHCPLVFFLRSCPPCSPPPFFFTLLFLFFPFATRQFMYTRYQRPVSELNITCL